MEIIVRKLKERFLLIIFICIVVFVFYTMFSYKPDVSKTPPLPTIQVGETIVAVVVADEENERIQGLSGMEMLPPNQGMLFIYDQPSYYTFWMKEMRFPLDFIWINNGYVVDITTDIQPPSYEDEPPNTVTPNSPATMILEVPAGFVSEHNIRIGDLAVF